MNEIQKRPEMLPDLADPLAGYHRTGDVDSVATRLRRLLRNRYRWLVLLMLVLGPACAAAGYFLKKPVWQSSGWVRIKPAMERVMYRPDDGGIQPWTYEPFVQSQVALLHSQRVVAEAMQQPEWKLLHADVKSPEAISDFLRQLTVASIQRSELITVVFEDTNPACASAGTSGVLKAYRSIYIERMQKNERDRDIKLRDRRDNTQRDRLLKRDQIDRLAQQYGTDDLRRCTRLRSPN